VHVFREITKPDFDIRAPLFDWPCAGGRQRRGICARLKRRRLSANTCRQSYAPARRAGVNSVIGGCAIFETADIGSQESMSCGTCSAVPVNLTVSTSVSKLGLKRKRRKPGAGQGNITWAAAAGDDKSRLTFEMEKELRVLGVSSVARHSARAAPRLRPSRCNQLRRELQIRSVLQCDWISQSRHQPLCVPERLHGFCGCQKVLSDFAKTGWPIRHTPTRPIRNGSVSRKDSANSCAKPLLRHGPFIII